MEPQELDATECRRLLASGVFGRVAICTPSGPHIIPVNYSVVGDRLVFRTTPYSVLGSYGRNSEMAFEVDHVDYEYGSGWSVVVRGRADAVVDPHEIQRLTTEWMPRPWASGSRNLFFALTWREISGRRLGPALGEARDLPVNRRAAQP